MKTKTDKIKTKTSMATNLFKEEESKYGKSCGEPEPHRVLMLLIMLLVMLLMTSCSSAL